MTYAHSAAPSGAYLFWADSRQFYLEFPCIVGPPYVVAFPRTSLGLSKALALIAPAMDHSGPVMIAPPKVRNPLAAKILSEMKVI